MPSGETTLPGDILPSPSPGGADRAARACSSHAERAAVQDCDRCGRPFCDDCVVALGGRRLCAACKRLHVRDLIRDEEVSDRRAHNAFVTALLGIMCMWCVLCPMALGQGITALRSPARGRAARDRWKAVAAIVISGCTLGAYVLYYSALLLFGYMTRP